MITKSSTNVTGVTPKPEPQYCVNIVAAIVKVTMLMQFASLDSDQQSVIEQN